MNLIDNWEHIQNRYDEFWARENHDRPLLFVTSGKDGTDYSQMPKQLDSIDDRWLDFPNVVARNRFRLENTYYAGEAFPYYMPNLGPDILGAILGCDIKFGEYTSWAEPIINNWGDYDIPALDSRNKWFQLMTELTDLAVADAKGDFLVGITDIHAGADAMVSLRGPQNLCLDLYDCPEKIMDLPEKIWPLAQAFYNDQYERTTHGAIGPATWLPVYHRQKWYVTSCDFICMISPGMFEQFILPELLLEASYFDANLFHLDGPGALKHLDRLLQIPTINGIQWVTGDGAPPPSKWKDVLVKIQNAGKNIHISVSPDELPVLAQYLAPEGVLLNVGCRNQAEADDVVKMADKLWKNHESVSQINSLN
jgi:hypothetical protein